MDMDAFTSTVALPDASVDAGTHPFSVLDAQPLPEGERHALKPRTIRLTPTRAPDPPIPAPDIAAPPPVTVRPSLTTALLQARESAMLFFRPSLNRHGLTEQQWRIIRVLRRYGELESHQLAELVCILKPSMTGVLQRMERDGLVQRRKPRHDQRRVYVSLSPAGQTCFNDMVDEVEDDYRRLEEKFGKEKVQALLALLDELSATQP